MIGMALFPPWSERLIAREGIRITLPAGYAPIWSSPDTPQLNARFECSLSFAYPAIDLTRLLIQESAALAFLVAALLIASTVSDASAAAQAMRIRAAVSSVSQRWHFGSMNRLQRAWLFLVTLLLAVVLHSSMFRWGWAPKHHALWYWQTLDCKGALRALFADFLKPDGNNSGNKPRRFITFEEAIGNQRPQTFSFEEARALGTSPAERTGEHLTAATASGAATEPPTLPPDKEVRLREKRLWKQFMEQWPDDFADECEFAWGLHFRFAHATTAAGSVLLGLAVPVGVVAFGGFVLLGRSRRA
ncbi:MAG TPA: hypothetical protein P5223_13545 [Phycisphaerae bacterium]|nr:hypothetical protein [Phycisphaerae bacterium]